MIKWTLFAAGLIGVLTFLWIKKSARDVGQPHYHDSEDQLLNKIALYFQKKRKGWSQLSKPEQEKFCQEALEVFIDDVERYIITKIGKAKYLKEYASFTISSKDMVVSDEFHSNMQKLFVKSVNHIDTGIDTKEFPHKWKVLSLIMWGVWGGSSEMTDGSLKAIWMQALVRQA